MPPVDKRRRARSILPSLGALALPSGLALSSAIVSLGSAVGASASIEPAGAAPAVASIDRIRGSEWFVGARRAEPQDEQRFVELINELRTGLGLEPLAVHPTLVPLARDWAAHLRSQGALSHAADLSIGVDEDWTRLGENVGVGPAGQVQELFDAFVASPTHYDNLVKPDYRYIGIGVVYGPDGRIWTAHRFMALDTSTADPPGSSPPPSTPSTTTDTSAAPPSTSPAETTPATTTAQTTTTQPGTTGPTTTQPSTVTTGETPPFEPGRATVSPPLIERLALDLAAAGL